jgi:hypothetical protein
MSYAQADIAESKAIIRSGEPPMKCNRRRADASLFIQTIDKMNDGEWLVVEDERTKRKLQSRVIWHQIHSGLRAFTYVAADGSLVVVKGDKEQQYVPQEFPKGMPVVCFGEPPKFRPTREAGKPRPRCPYVCCALRLAPGEWFKLPDTAFWKFRYSLSKYRTRDRILLDVSIRQTESLEWIVIRRKP